MKGRFISAALWLLLSQVVWANPCALPGQFDLIGSGMGGTGHTQDGSGIGGTGIQREDGGIGGTGHRNDGGGMGGTGSQADGSGKGGTGVVGLITGFGSICVNGIELHYDDTTPVLVDGEKKSAEHLSVGQLVAAEAEGQGQSLRARQIAVHSALAGPVSWVSPSGDGFVALGQSVRLPSNGAPGQAWLPRVGDHVRVYGFHEASGAIRASTVERIATSDRASLQGRVDYAGGSVARVGGLVVTAAGKLRTGDFARIDGTLKGDQLRAQRVEVKPGLGVSSQVDRLVLQGVAKPAPEAGRLSLGYADVDLPAGVAAGEVAHPGDLIRVEAQRRPDGRFEARRIVIDRPVREVQPHFDRAKTQREREEHERHGDRYERHERESSERHERAEKPEREVREGAIEKSGRPERAERLERPEKPERVELPEKPELPERIELPERPEVPELPELPERPEVPELPERHDD